MENIEKIYDEELKKAKKESREISKIKNVGRYAIINEGIIVGDEDRKEIIQRSLETSLRFFKAPKVDESTIEQRCLEYFATCYHFGDNPTVEGLVLALGLNRANYYEWKNGKKTKYIADILQKCNLIIQAYDTDLLMRNKINVAGYIFRAKNYYEMVDKVEHSISINDPLDDVQSLDDLISMFPKEVIDAEYEDK